MTPSRIEFRHPRRAMTTVELIMAIAVGVVLLGVVLGVFIQTQRASDRVILREQMMQEALVIEYKLGALLQRAVPDGRLGFDGLPASRFAGDEIEFYATDNGLARWSLAARPAGGGDDAPVQVASRRTGVDGGSLLAAGAPLPLGVGFDKFDSRIQFQFAKEYDGLTPQWSDASAGAPIVVRYTITVSDRQDRAAPIQVSNSIRWPDLD